MPPRVAGGPTLVPDPARLEGAPPELIARLDGDVFNYFRFLNIPWAQRVCGAFADQAARLPAVHLHGDAHVEQYAFTSTARGLDDFDDSALGPSVIDLVRFLGSVHLAARNRGWLASEAALFDRFLDGYRKGLTDRRYLPPDPAVVRRLRGQRPLDGAGFLAWADSLMVRPDAEDLARAEASLKRLDDLVRSVQPNLPAGFLKLKKVGWLSTGVGSALTRKVLARVEGPSPAPDDDLVIEAKELSDLRAVSCLSVPPTGEAFRVITGIEQLGRVRHRIVAIVPQPPQPRRDAAPWWVRTWDPSYAEVTLRDFASVDELGEVVYDSGVQLGAGGLREVVVDVERQKRQTELDALARLEPRIRSVSRELAEELVAEWEKFKARGGAPR
jgi:hypothetical protein